MKKIQILILFVSVALTAAADIYTDRAMNKISRDSKTYISADARAATEDEAYNAALINLSEKITDYLKKENKGKSPDAVYLQKISSIYSRLSSKTSANRYHVMLYVEKKGLMSLDDTAIVLSKNMNDQYEAASVSMSGQTIITDTVNEMIHAEMVIPPVLSALAQAKSKDEVTSELTSLRKSGKISGAALFPLSSFDEYYLVVLNSIGQVSSILKFKYDTWVDLLSGKNVKLNDYKDCSAYWITL